MTDRHDVFDWLGIRLRLARGTARDYAALARFHYATGRPASFAQVWVIRYGNDAGRVAAVAVVSYPPLRCMARERALGWTQTDPCRLAALVNQRLRTISRVIVHPQFRGVGLASVLVRTCCVLARTPLVESIARMGAAHPLFVRGGMTRCPAGRDEPAYFLYRAIGEPSPVMAAAGMSEAWAHTAAIADRSLSMSTGLTR